jgi:hypothetical protein
MMSIKQKKRLSWVCLTVAAGIIAWQGVIASEKQQRLEKAEQHLELALWGSDNGLFDLTVPRSSERIIGDRDQWYATHAWYNEQFGDLLGNKTPSPPYGRTFLERICPEDQASVINAIEIAVRRRNGVEVVFQAEHTDGTHHWFAPGYHAQDAGAAARRFDHTIIAGRRDCL